MTNTGLKDIMLSGKSEYIDAAVYMLSTRYPDDIHTKYGITSYSTGYELREKAIKAAGEGPSRTA